MPTVAPGPMNSLMSRMPMIHQLIWLLAVMKLAVSFVLRSDHMPMKVVTAM